MATWAVTTANSALEFDTIDNNHNSCFIIDSNHFINFWSNTDANAYAQVFTVNTSTWAVTTANSSLNFETARGRYSSCFKIDTNHFINFYEGSGDDGFVGVFTVNTTTWAVTTANAPLEFDTTLGQFNSCYQIDSNHFINFWSGSGNDGFVQVFTVNTTTWAVTTANATLEFDTTLMSVTYPSSVTQMDANHFIKFWSGNGDDGFAQIFTVNTTTWAVTTANASLEFETQYSQSHSCYKIDSTHVINFWGGVDTGAGTTYDGFVQVFTVNTTTWAVTTAANSLEFDATQGMRNCCNIVDSNHFINFWNGTDSDGFVQVFTVNTTTWAVTTSAASLEFDTGTGSANSCFRIDTNHYINFFRGTDADGFAQVFTVMLPGAENLKTYNTNIKSNIKTINTNVIANVKTLNTNP